MGIPYFLFPPTACRIYAGDRAGSSAREDLPQLPSHRANDQRATIREVAVKGWIPAPARHLAGSGNRTVIIPSYGSSSGTTDLGRPGRRGAGSLSSFLWLGCFLPFHSRLRQLGQRMGIRTILWRLIQERPQTSHRNCMTRR
jgi:hypothetical protein